MKTILKLTLVLTTSLLLTHCKQKKEEQKFLPSTKPKMVINHQDVFEMIRFYKETRASVLQKALGKEDAHTNWVSLDSLKHYIAYIEANAKKNNLKISGINIMAAAYTNDAKYGKKQNYQTLVFVPTTLVEGKHIGFEPLLSSQNNITTFKELYAKHISRSEEFLEYPPDSSSSFANKTKPEPPYMINPLGQ